jgi:membrane fusion protein (multidrug efflux system)
VTDIPSDDTRAETAAAGDAAHGKPAPKKASPLKNPLTLLILVVIVAALLVAGVMFWLNGRQYAKTDDAFVDTHIVRLAPQVSGQVSRVLADDNARVKAGQVLVEIDPSSARTTLQQAFASRAQALAKLAEAQAQLGANAASVQQARDQASALASQAAVAGQDARRFIALQAAAPRAVAAQQVDQAVGQARTAQAQRAAAEQQANVATAQAKAARTSIAAAQAELDSADAVIAQNKLTVGHNQVIAPVDGYISQKSVAPGGYVQPGQQLMAIVPAAMWVTANFKETQLARMRPGQPADLKIDACPVHLSGHVASVQRGSGQAFALLPTENATGNYVKVVQRVPVKITFDAVPADCPLGPGLSVLVSVKVR